MNTMRVWPSGHLIDPLDPDPALICIEDVAHHLAGIFRYGGASRLTVAQHCCEMALYILRSMTEMRNLGAAVTLPGPIRTLAFEYLMHDAAEYLLGDMIRPLKHGEFGGPYLGAEANLESVLKIKFGYGDPAHAEAVKYLDSAMCATEQRDLFHSGSDIFTNFAKALPEITIHPWQPEHAEHEFLRLYELLKPRAAQVAA